MYWLKLHVVSSVPANFAKYWRDPHIPGLGLLRADFTTHEYCPHVHEEWVVAATEHGGAIVKSQGVAEDARDDTLLIFNPGEPQSARMGTSPRWIYRALYLDRSAMQQLLDAVGVRGMPHFRQAGIADAIATAQFLALHRALESGHEPLEQRERLVGLLGRLFEQHGRGATKPLIVPRDRVLFSRVDGVMRLQYASDLSLASLAETVGLTSFQLIGLFKRVTGLTPHAYLTQIRIRVARDRLEQGWPLTVVAGETGFYDQSALTRHFKRSFGITPGQFAAAYGNSPGQRRQ